MKLSVFLTAILATPMVASGALSATLTSDYLLIATGSTNGDNGVGDALHLSDSELGAISDESGTNRFNAVSPPQGNPGFGGAQGPQTGVITRDGDVAITSGDGAVTMSNSDIHTANTGPNTPGAQGIDCAATYNRCTDNGTQVETGSDFGAGGSSNGFNTTPLPTGPTWSGVAKNNGVQGDIAMANILSDIDKKLVTAGSYNDGNATQTLNFDDNSLGFSGGKVDSNFTLSLSSGLNIIDIYTGASGLLLDTANWIVDGSADSFVIFRIESGEQLSSQNGNFLLGNSGIGLNNIMFLVDDGAGDGSFSFDNTEFYGYSFWDVHNSGLKNEAVFNNVRGCGQVVTDKINFNNVSMTNCAYSAPPSVPVPAGLPLLFAGLGALAFIRRRQIWR